MFQCLECGKTMKRPREECPQCGGSDIDVAPRHPAHRSEAHDYPGRVHHVKTDLT